MIRTRKHHNRKHRRKTLHKRRAKGGQYYNAVAPQAQNSTKSLGDHAADTFKKAHSATKEWFSGLGHKAQSLFAVNPIASRAPQMGGKRRKTKKRKGRRNHARRHKK